MSVLTDNDLAQYLLGADAGPRRRALAKAITLIESSRCDDQLRAEALLDTVHAYAGASFRLGVTGPPGIGKSTFVDALGAHLIQRGEKVAVLCVDPESSLSGGAILADKTRMDRLAGDRNAYIRPSAGASGRGGIAAQTRAAVRLCEAAGFNFVIVETVGTGQNESAVATMTDMLCLLQGPHFGDEMQIFKKGIYEHVDLVLVNRSDLGLGPAQEASRRIGAALRISGQNRNSPWRPLTRTISALTGDGIAAVADTIYTYRTQLAPETARRRTGQDTLWLKECLGPRRFAFVQQHPNLKESLVSLAAQVEGGQLAAPVAARELIGLMGSYGAPPWD